MKLRDLYELNNGKWRCKYVVTSVGVFGYTLTRVKRAETKADNNRFPEIININFIGSILPEKTESYGR
jgi:hypothetical protein